MSRTRRGSAGRTRSRRRPYLSAGPVAPDPDEPPLAGLDGVRATAGLMVQETISPYLSLYASELGRVLPFTTSNMMYHRVPNPNAANPPAPSAYAEVLANAQVVFMSPTTFRQHPTVTVASTLAIIQGNAPANGGGSPPLAYRQEEWDRVCDGETSYNSQISPFESQPPYDDIVHTVCDKIESYINFGCPPPIIRLAHEPEIAGYPWFKGGIDEAVWVEGWTRWRDIIKTRLPSVLIDYQGNGPWLDTTWATRIQQHNAKFASGHPNRVPAASGDNRICWEVGLPDPADIDIFGTDVYAGSPRTPANVLSIVRQVQQVALSLGKPFSIPEFGASPDSKKGTIGLVDVGTAAQRPLSVRYFMEDLINLLAGFPASGPGSCAYWSYFEMKADYTMGNPWSAASGHWPQTYVYYGQTIGDN